MKYFTESTDEAFTRNHLVISMHQPVGLEVRGIEEELCFFQGDEYYDAT
jgi:hypothetical protein